MGERAESHEAMERSKNQGRNPRWERRSHQTGERATSAVICAAWANIQFDEGAVLKLGRNAIYGSRSSARDKGEES